jgi:hypothetical protein
VGTPNPPNHRRGLGLGWGAWVSVGLPTSRLVWHAPLSRPATQAAGLTFREPARASFLIGSIDENMAAATKRVLEPCTPARQIIAGLARNDEP